MKAIVANQLVQGDNFEAVLREVDLEKPVPKGRDVLISVKAVATNPVDTKVLAGAIGLKPSESSPVTVGWDGAGVIESVGDAASIFKVGDEVFFAGSIMRAGCFAEYVLVDERIVALKPRNLSFADAASLPLTTITAWESLTKLLHVPIPVTKEQQAGNAQKTILVVGGAGGVGSIATQLAKHFLHLNVISTASRDTTVQWVKNLGADHTINHQEPLWPQIQKLGLKGVHYILCCTDITAQYYADFIECCVPLAKIAYITTNGDNVNLGALMLKSLSIAGEFMFTRPIFGDDIEFQHELLSRAAELVEKNILTATKNYEYAYNLENLIQALKLQYSGRAIGKIVLTRA